MAREANYTPVFSSNWLNENIQHDSTGLNLPSFYKNLNQRVGILIGID